MKNVYDVVEQYKNDRSPAEVLFSFKRCMAHFAVDDNEVRMCTELKGKKSWFGHIPAKGQFRINKRNVKGRNQDIWIM